MNIQRLIEWLQRRRHGRLVETWQGYPPAISGGGVQGWEESLESITANGTAIANSTSEALLCPDFNLPAYYMAAGRTLRLWAAGLLSSVGSSPGTLTVRVRWGGLAGTTLLATNAMAQDSTARTDVGWCFTGHIVCRTSGVTGTFMNGGIFFTYAYDAAAAYRPINMGSAGISTNAAVTVDTTAAKLLSVTGQFSVASASNTMLCQQRVIEVLN